MESLWHDLRYALRNFRQNLGFTLVDLVLFAVMYWLTLGVGALLAASAVTAAVRHEPRRQGHRPANSIDTDYRRIPSEGPADLAVT